MADDYYHRDYDDDDDDDCFYTTIHDDHDLPAATSAVVCEQPSAWANLSAALGERTGASVLPQMVAAMAHVQDLDIADGGGGGEVDLVFTLPSDYAWRTKIYLKLLSRQKHIAQLKMEDPLYEEPTGILHDWNIIPAERKLFCAPLAEKLARKAKILSGPGPITWTVSDIAKAGTLLSGVPSQEKVVFDDEQEMRRVYTLIYDVFRYKTIMNKALNDVLFFQTYPELEPVTARIWLLLFDLYHRSFKKRDPATAVESARLFAVPAAGLVQPEGALWREKVKLAAAVARLRIKFSALRLNELLPAHLRDERVAAHMETTPVACWVNYRKIKSAEDINAIIKRVFALDCLDDSEGTLTPDTFKWDSHCPSFVLFHPCMRTKLAQSALVQKFKLIVQDRSFCFGPATFGKILNNLQLTGSVVQSHINSPRTTAYLASLLSYNEKIKKLFAFSAGNRKSEYDSYFNDLGLKNVAIFSEKLSDIAVNSSFLEEVIAVFATPPNTYTAVADPIDLVCSRGGDLSMLEVLTESEDTPEGRRRVKDILDEQRKTLRFAMARPQIQLVLYETHSELDAENNAMIQKTVKEINKITRVHHATLQGKLRRKISSDSFEEEIPEEGTDDETLVAPKIVELDNEVEIPLQENADVKVEATPIVPSEDDDEYMDIAVPETDLFDVPAMPELCLNSESCINIQEQGCYLALVQRKVVTKLDHKYMIQMAETRGLFGNDKDGAGKKKTTKRERAKKPEPTPQPKTKRKGKEIEIGRISAPTLASLKHSRNIPIKIGLTNTANTASAAAAGECTREAEAPVNKYSPRSLQTRRWWRETTRHITNLRTSLVRQKVIPSIAGGNKGSFTATSFDHNANATRVFVGSLMEVHHHRIDEIVAKTSTRTTIPVYPRLRLSRKVKRVDKVAIPMAVTMVKLPKTFSSANSRIINTRKVR